MTTPTNTDMRAAMIEARDWFESQAKAVSKGCGSSYELHDLRTQRDALDKALAAPAQAVPASIITASVMRDDGGEHPAFCLMVAYRAEKDAMTALAMLTDEPAQPATPAHAGDPKALPLAITCAPERIWLDLGFDPEQDDVHFSNLHDLTWSADNATGNGIEYVRATRAARGAAQVAPSEELAKRLIGDVEVADSIATATCQRVADLDDRDSPNYWPEAMLVTGAELHMIVREAVIDAQAALVEAAVQPDRTGIYAWVSGSSTAMVLVNKRPSNHAPGGQWNGHVIDSTRFYDGCPITHWGRDGRWTLLHDFGAARAAQGGAA